MIKKFEHEKIESCKLCNKDIDTKKEKYNVLIDFDKVKIEVIGFYHRKCLNDFMKRSVNIIKDKFKSELIGFTKNMLGRIKIES